MLSNHIKLHWNIAQRMRMIFNFHTYLCFIIERRYGHSHKFTKRLYTTQDYQIQIKGSLDSNLIRTTKPIACEKNYIPLTNFYYRNDVEEVRQNMDRPISTTGGTAMYQKPRNLRQEEYNIFEIVIDGYETLLQDIKNISYTQHRLDEVKKYTNKTLKILREIKDNITVVDDHFRFKTDQYIYGW